MELQLSLPATPAPASIQYSHELLFTGSCFAEKIATTLKQHKFNVTANPFGSLFDPGSICRTLMHCMDERVYTANELQLNNELWHHWDFHSCFSGMDKTAVLQQMNSSRELATGILKKANWLIITLGTAFRYQLAENNAAVANCHKFPAKHFRKTLMTSEEILADLDNLMHRLFFFNKDIRILFTISPVRHIRDGLVENNLSKARLIDAVHKLVAKFERLYYFPAYELVMDVLRDYRFFDKDMVHPNDLATEFVFNHFTQTFIDQPSRQLMAKVASIIQAAQHRAFNANTNAHKSFKAQQLKLCEALEAEFPFLNFEEEKRIFQSP